MPIFEYSCTACRLPKFSALFGVSMHATPPVCPRCGSGELTKLVSRFRRLRSEDDALDDLTDLADTMNPDDPKAVRRLVKEMAGSMGDGGEDDFEAMMEEAIEEEAGGGGADESVLESGG
ncbi:MAG: zinc ribbon domain-containing protein [Fibrella sp.]|nr:zinc ribbon domain-containing protein [Armatimonadota bacterium]